MTKIAMAIWEITSRMPVAMTRGGATYYLTYDQVGSLRIVANSAGNVVKRIDYDSFGNIIGDTDPLFDMPFGFAEGLHDRDTGFLRFGYRDYDPDTGRWTAKDPIGFAGGDTDLYGYVLNDPVNDIDPLGLHGLVFFGRGPYIFRPFSLRPAPKYVSRPIPKTTPKPKLRRVFRPLPQIVRSQPKPWWYWFLRLVKPVEDIVDPPLDLYPFVPGMDNNIDPCGRHYT